MEPRDVLREFAVELLALPVKQPLFSAILMRKGLLHGNLLSQVNAIHLTNVQAAQLFVQAIDSTLLISRDSFDKLISAMKEYRQGGMEQLAIKLQGAAKPNPAGTYICTYYLWHSMRKLNLHAYTPTHYFFIPKF